VSNLIILLLENVFLTDLTIGCFKSDLITNELTKLKTIDKLVFAKNLKS
jgi:hypothetical protein